MAMLAEPKKKSKCRIQPFSGFSKTNRRCDDDNSSFGYKLMSSMGWEPGKGLGLHESGDVDPIKVRLKNDGTGLGYKVYEDAALAQQSEFQALLLQLNSGATDEEIQSKRLEKKSKKLKIKSLEKQSEQSSVRVHYKKFLQGKDLSRASEKDLKCILGISSKTLKIKQPGVKLPEPVGDDTEAHRANMYTPAGSSVDYFKKRYHEKKIKSQLLEEEEAVMENQDRKRRSVTWGDVDVSYVDKYIKDMVDTSGSLDESLIDNICTEEPIKKNKRKKKNQLCPLEESEGKNAVSGEANIENQKKKRKMEEDSCKENLVQELEDHSVSKKKKKRKSKSQDFDEQILEASNDIHYSETEALCVEELQNSNLVLDDVPKEKRKKKKKKNQVSALPNKTH